MLIRGRVVERDGGRYLVVGSGRLTVRLPEAARVVEGGVKVPVELVAKDPWLRLAAEVHEVDYEVPVVEGGKITLVGPVVEVEGGFLGYKVVTDEAGRFLDVLDAGKYRRVVVPGLEEYANALPVVKLAGLDQLSEEEARLLAANTPATLIPILLGKEGALRRLGELAAVEKVKRDPLSLLELPPEDARKVITVAARYWREASPETSPAIIELLIEELRAVAPDAVPELQYLYERLREEKHEEQQLERAKEEQARTFLEYARRLREEQARQRARQQAVEIRRLVRELLGVSLPVATLVSGRRGPASTVEKKAVEAARERVGVSTD